MNLLELLLIYLKQPAYLSLTIGSLLVAALLWYASRNQKLSVGTRVFLIYAHIAVLLVPLAFFAYSSGCMLPVYDCNAKTLLYALPFILGGVVALAGVVGYFMLPALYRRRLGAQRLQDKQLARLVARMARKHGGQVPSLWLLDTASPMAFSVSSHHPAIFVSLGLFDILSRKELEAVVLHELGHLQHRSPLVKFSTQLARAVSPVALFVPGKLNHEEQCADTFAIAEQGTPIHVTSARGKIESFFAFQE
ncbi:MAG TPA: M48 family metalloprotease [Candidatus Binatia bacterium]|nr:M48 family metalloprotease [Candidatus Binatia bacterium]